jgi:hypothetical protein
MTLWIIRGQQDAAKFRIATDAACHSINLASATRCFGFRSPG